ncbi:MAG: bifunctional UDP-sugar hydrolase/5'-nucleotidase [Clostridia bacterium]
MKKNLKIFYTSDIHAYFFDTDYRSREHCDVGLFGLCNQFSRDENTLVIDGGDMLQGSPLATYVRNNLNECAVFSQIMNDAGYDYIALGNHDFNFGYDVLKSYVNNLNGKLLGANVVDLRGEMPILPFDIKVMPNGLKVGIVGGVTDYVNLWEAAENLTDIKVEEVFSALKNSLEKIKSQCDVTICVYHGGFEAPLDDIENVDVGTENVGIKICRELNFDLLLTSHQHCKIEGRTLYGTHTLQLPSNGASFAEINLAVDGENIAIDSKQINSNYSLSSKIDVGTYSELENSTQDWLDEPVGQLSENIGETDTLKLMKDGSRFADMCNAMILDHSGADFSCVSLMNCPYALQKTVTIRDIVSSYPFVNMISKVEVSIAELKVALERVAEFYSIQNGQLKINDKFLKPKMELYNYDFYYGFDYVLDVSKPVGQRVVEISKNGASLNLDEKYVVAMSSYRATGTGGYDVFRKAKNKQQDPKEVQQLLIENIMKNKLTKLPPKSGMKIVY